MADVNITLHVNAANLFVYPSGLKDGPVLDHCYLSDDQGGGPEKPGCLSFLLPAHPVKDYTTHVVQRGKKVRWIPNSLDNHYIVNLLEIKHVETLKFPFWIAWILWFFFGLHRSKNFFKPDAIGPSATDSNGEISKEIDYNGKIYDYEIKFTISKGEETKEYTVHPRLKM